MDFRISDDARAVADLCRTFAASHLAPFARERDEQGRFDAAVVRQLGDAGILGGALPTDVGGRAWSKVAYALAMEELGAVDNSWRGFVTVQGSLVGLCLLDHGDATQRREHLPPLAAGTRIYAYALTEPSAGTDVAALSTRAVPDGDGWRISGEKHWITNGGAADFILVFATVDPALKHKGITGFLVRGDAPGLVRRPMEGSELGHRGSNHARLVFDGVRVGPSDVVGGVGKGFRVAMGGLEHGRLGVAAGAVGIQRACLDEAVAFAKSRRQFGQRIGDFQMIQKVVADMHANLEASRLLVMKAAALKDAGLPNQREVSTAKLFATDAAVRAADETILLLGSRGYTSLSPAGRMLRDAKGMQIYEGTSHVQRLIIARDLLGKDEG